jgi:heme exporter protein C
VLVLWLLYVVYVMIRISVESSQRRAIISAVYGILAFLDVPLVYLSTRLMPEIHPTSVSLDSPMKLTLGIWFIPVMLLTAGLIVFRFRLNQAQRSIADAEPIEDAAPAPLRWVGGAL